MNILTLKFTVTVFLLSFLVSCTKPIFYWGNYSHTLYKMKKNADTESREKHKKELLEIMEKSKKKKKYTIPPGVYCEYGYLLYQEGNNDEALKYYGLEKETYPESKTFVDRLSMMITGVKTAVPDTAKEDSNIPNTEKKESQSIPIENKSENE